MAGADFTADLRLPAALLAALLLAGSTMPTGAEDEPAAQPELERHLMRRLAEVQADPGNRLTPFVSDGCSGGLSVGWQHLAEHLPAFRARFGAHPPFEPCCIEHDRRYWRGPTDGGTEQRQAADAALRECVVATGRARREEFARELGLEPAIIASAFDRAAQLMYAAVRLGGLPCTPFDWRWGFGWPACDNSQP